jgi:hypothetical protein
MADVLTTVKTILRYVVDVEGREFDVVITSDGMSNWSDQSRGSLGGLMSHLRDEDPAFNISLSVSKEILMKASEMARKEHQARGKIGFKSPSISLQMDIAEMDTLLREFFWNKVEPLTNQYPGLAS